MTESKKTLLVVEDDYDTRNAICTMLEALGFGFIAFGTGKEALEGLNNKHIDLALLDIMMPDMNGYELMAQLKEIALYKEVPIVMVTARDKDSEILEGYKQGADYYITKPFTTKQLEYGIKLFLN